MREGEFNLDSNDKHSGNAQAGGEPIPEPYLWKPFFKDMV
jgi:hypothetical protein